MIEREKRWKLKGEIPSDKIVDKFTITQCYANFKPDVRIRKINKDNSEEYSHCVKYSLNNDTEREEVEQKISKERYNRIFEAINKEPVIKERTIVDIGDGLFAEVDSYKDTGNTVVEVEFPKESDIESFSPPSWFGSEIKNNKSFSYTIFCKINNISISLWD